MGEHTKSLTSRTFCLTREKNMQATFSNTRQMWDVRERTEREMIYTGRGGESRKQAWLRTQHSLWR